MALNDKDLTKVLIGDHLVLEQNVGGQKTYTGVSVTDFDKHNNLEIDNKCIFDRNGNPLNPLCILDNAKLLPLTDETIKLIKK